ncbi:hypothetical protein RF11_06233 [Thelohanellus kitauei]|uniref:Aminotransferase class I/classII large domain-containing protein n=1 Tax=Thelohanellus kitauei TaxID=669202 RepID=A0A0C2M9N3_THEKT|nr:hypothetical protein RF11_06233 [Thelohanellus kitauei]
MSGLSRLTNRLRGTLGALKEAGLYQEECILTCRQGSRISCVMHKELLNFSSDNYLGLADIHKQLETVISSFHNKEDAICYPSGLHAVTGLFSTLFDRHDAIISDQLNNPTIAQAISVSEAQKSVYKHLDTQLQKFRPVCENIIIATEGVFSLEGSVAPLLFKLFNLGRYVIWRANTRLSYLLMTLTPQDFLAKLEGSPEYCQVMEKVDIINSSLGKALGGAAGIISHYFGGYTTSSSEIVDWLRQNSLTYLFSNSLPPPMVGNALAGKDHPICSILIHNENSALQFYRELLCKSSTNTANGIYVSCLTYPLVPKGLLNRER